MAELLPSGRPGHRWPARRQPAARSSATPTSGWSAGTMAACCHRRLRPRHEPAAGAGRQPRAHRRPRAGPTSQRRAATGRRCLPATAITAAPTCAFYSQASRAHAHVPVSTPWSPLAARPVPWLAVGSSSTSNPLRHSAGTKTGWPLWAPVMNLLPHPRPPASRHRQFPTKQALRKLWVDVLGLRVASTFVSERENVDEDIRELGWAPTAWRWT